MQRRWLAGVAIVAAAGVAYVATGGDEAAPRKTSTDAPTRAAAPAQMRRAATPARETPGRVYVNGTKHDPSPGVKKWKQDGLPGTFREVVAPDDGPNYEEQMLYKKRRLRFRLTDAAAACYEGGDGKESISFAYTLVVANEELRTENVRVLQSNLRDAKLESCITDAVKSLRSDATGMPDARYDSRGAISLHDLWVRNRSVD
jgi:hypothetical protein